MRNIGMGNTCGRDHRWMNMIRFALRLGGFLVGICWLVACQPVTPTPSAQEIVQRSADHMKALAGFSFSIDRQGEPAYLNADETIAFRRCEGRFQVPDRAAATVRVIAPGVVAEVKIVGIGDDYWETNLLTGEWQYLPGGLGFNPAVLFDSQIGFQPILEADLSGLEHLGLAELAEMPGVKLHHLSGQLQGQRIYQMSYGMIGPETLAIELWIDPVNYALQRILINDPNQGEATLWQIDFWDFGRAAPVEPPAEKSP